MATMAPVKSSMARTSPIVTPGVMPVISASVRNRVVAETVFEGALVIPLWWVITTTKNVASPLV